MKVENGIITEATDEELYNYYLTRDWDIVMSYRDFKERCRKNGTKVTDEKDDVQRTNDSPWLDRYFGTVCRNQKTHPNAMRLDDGTVVFGEPTCKRCEGCGYEPITPNTPAWDDDGEDNQ